MVHKRIKKKEEEDQPEQILFEVCCLCISAFEYMEWRSGRITLATKYALDF